MKYFIKLFKKSFMVFVSFFSRMYRAIYFANAKRGIVSAKGARVTIQTLLTLGLTGFILTVALPGLASATTDDPAINKSITAQEQQETNKQMEELQKGDSKATIVPVTRDPFTVIGPQTSIASYSFSGVPAFANDATASIQWPFLAGVPIGDGFGPRVAPCPDCSTNHHGVDFEPGDGAEIQSIADGVVTQVVNVNDPNDLTNAGSLGSYVVIASQIDGQTITAVYGHMQYQSSPLIVGQAVKVMNFVGKTGQTGQATGPHLYFELDVNGTPVDPMIWLAAHNH
jgi:murein DD-endopeptidase MepM/ murein hydrolase activator NlpD